MALAGNMAWWGAILLGVCAGTLSGALGVGSGILLIPSLVLLAQLPQKTAQGASLAVMVCMGIIGALRYHYNQDINIPWLLVAFISIGAIAGSYAGSSLAFVLPATVLKKVFGIFIVIVGLRMILK